MDDIFGDIDEIVGVFLKPMEKDKNNRGWSWNHCYTFFQKYKNYDSAKQKSTKDLACLNLGFYLASWGMYRGSSFLLSKDYKVFEGVIDLLRNQKNEEIWAPDYYVPLLQGLKKITIDSKQVVKVFGLYSEIKQYFENTSFIKDSLTSRWEQAKATDTLVTKILLGTMACSPAYDTLFKNGLKTKKISYRSYFSDKSLSNLLEVCRQANLLEKIKNLGKYKDYPIMKLVDIYFWGIGLRQNGSKNSKA